MGIVSGHAFSLHASQTTSGRQNVIPKSKHVTHLVIGSQCCGRRLPISPDGVPLVRHYCPKKSHHRQQRPVASGRLLHLSVRILRIQQFLHALRTYLMNIAAVRVCGNHVRRNSCEIFPRRRASKILFCLCCLACGECSDPARRARTEVAGHLDIGCLANHPLGPAHHSARSGICSFRT